MNVFQLVLKQMRQRSLSTWLTILSILLGVMLAIAILILQREGGNLFSQTDFGYDIIIGPPKGSALELTLNTVYGLEKSQGVIPYSLYEDMSRKSRPPQGHADFRRMVKIAVPIMVGDSYKGRRIVGTSPEFFGFNDDGQEVTGQKFEYRLGKSFQFAEGRAFAPRKFEAVVGSELASKLGMKLYDNKLSEKQNQAEARAFQATHGFPGPNQTPDIHKPVWHVVGILKPTHTASDRVLYVPFISLYAIAEHEEGMLVQLFMRNNIDPTRVPPEKVDQTLIDLGIDPKTIPDSAKKQFKQAYEQKKAAATRPTPAASPAPGGELLQDAKTVAPTPAPPPTPVASAGGDDDEPVFTFDKDGNIVPDLPQAAWELSAILVRSRGPVQEGQIEYIFKNIDNRAIAVNPAGTMREFFQTFLAGTAVVLLLIACLVTIVAAVSIMTTIYNSVSARRREIAILRALGATRRRILLMICLEAGTVGLFGGVAGFVCGHFLAAAGSVYLNQTLGEGINWFSVGWEEFAYLGAVVVIAIFAGLVPALKAYRVSVATNLVAE
ncbi:MAG TPA: ABC transporter permease [Tepidisphaeraceae bacterium]|jgi:putative ABC transport system permease protein|nr:ABC transporter permease [Tepidisphaeraceae bacterium]